MRYDDGFLALDEDQGIARWGVDGISNGYFKFEGTVSIDRFIRMSDFAVTAPSINNSNPQSNVVSLSMVPGPINWDSSFQYLLIRELLDLGSGKITVVIDGVTYEMEADVVAAFIRSGAYIVI